MKTADAIKHFGSAAKLAEALETTRSAISQWGETVPKNRTYEIEIKSNYTLKCDYTLDRLAKEGVKQ